MKTKNGLIWLWLSLAVIVIDQISKYLVVKNLTLGMPYKVLPFLNLTFAQNRGAAFSFLSSTGNYALWLFAVVAIVISVILVAWLKKISRHRHWLGAALAFILGGAVGNLIDRFTHGFVVDFFDFHLKNWHFFTFNVADSAITIGAVMLIIDILFIRD